MNAELHISERVLILTPTGNDAANALAVLEQAEMGGVICRDCPELESKFLEGAGALLIAEEALTPGGVDSLVRTLKGQAPWADISLLLITSANESEEAGQALLNTFAPHGNVMLIERPLRPISLVSALRVALRARRRQYQLGRILEEQQKILTNIQRSERQFRAVFNQQFQFMAILSPEGIVLEMNELPLRSTGIDYQQVKGKLFWETPFWSGLPEMRAHWPKRLAEAARSSGPVLSVDTFATADGGVRVADAAVTAVKNRQGEVELFIVQATDITERRMAEEALRASRTELAQANEQLSSRAKQLERLVQKRTEKLMETIEELEGFSYSITHDMRAPLRAVNGLSQILVDDYGPQLDEPGRRLLERIQQAVTRMDQLIQDVLNYSRVLGTELRLEPVDSDRLVRGILDSYPDLQEPKASVRIEGQLPMVMANAAALTQCFSNLLNNAVKFVAPGIKPQVKVRATRGKSKVRFWIEDNGIGIEPRYFDNIFELFQRITKDYEGTGVGLSIVRKAVQRMGGQAGVLSAPGKGSRFWFDLQLAESRIAG